VMLDTNEAWAALLNNPPVGQKEGSCIRGAFFYPEAFAPTLLGIRGSIST